MPERVLQARRSLRTLQVRPITAEQTPTKEPLVRRVVGWALPSSRLWVYWNEVEVPMIASSMLALPRAVLASGQPVPCSTCSRQRFVCSPNSLLTRADCVSSMHIQKEDSSDASRTNKRSIYICIRHGHSVYRQKASHLDSRMRPQCGCQDGPLSRP